MTNTSQENMIAEMWENRCMACGHEPHCATACDYGVCDCQHCACDDCIGD